MFSRAILGLVTLVAVAACSADSVPVAAPAGSGPSNAVVSGADKEPPAAPSQSTGQDYLNLLWATIKRHYEYPQAFRRDGLTGSTLYEMTLDRTGEIVSLDLRKSSGNRRIDQFASSVIRRSQPLPPVPPNLPGPTLTVRVLVQVGPDPEQR